MKVQALTLNGALAVLRWRNQVPEAFRTPQEITPQQQKRWYRELQERGDMRFWELYDDLSYFSDHDNKFCVFGLTNIEPENGRAQISMVASEPKQGYGEFCLHWLFDMAFNRMRLHTIYAECYTCNPNRGFWGHMASKYPSHCTSIPSTKFWDGKWHNSIFITFYEGQAR